MAFSMNKIALVTIHDAGNYGASLQAFASQKVLSKYGSVEIIDYKNDYLALNSKLFRFSSNPRAFLRVAKDLLRFPSRSRALKKFRSFRERHLVLSRSFNFHELYHCAHNYDYYVSGSDQIWNPVIVSESNSFDPVFFLDFVKSGIKIAYASSAGSYDFSVENLEAIKKYLESYSAISVREKSLSKKISTLLGNDVPSVLDPTLMLSKSEWADAIGLSKKGKPYLLAYALKPDDFFSETVNYVAQKLSLEVVALDQSPYLSFRAAEHIKDAGPEDYLRYFSSASFVVTNSFHGTAFSTNFNVPFLAVRPIHGQNRITNFLDLVGLSGRFIDDLSQLRDIPLDFSFEEANVALQGERDRCFGVLDRMFDNVEGLS